MADTGARVVASIWGRTIEDYYSAAQQLIGADVVAVEVNVSCPNLEDRKKMFAHDPESAAAVIRAAKESGHQIWAKLSPNVTDIVEIASAVQAAGADAVTLTNTVMGLVIDTSKGMATLGNGGGGLSGPAVRPVAVRAVYEVHAAIPDLPIVGVGGVARAEHAVEFLMAGASAIQVGTATFADPRASTLVVRGLAKWCGRNNISSIAQLIGAAHDR